MQDYIQAYYNLVYIYVLSTMDEINYCQQHIKNPDQICLKTHKKVKIPLLSLNLSFFSRFMKIPPNI